MVFRVKIAEIERSEFVVMCFNNSPELVFVSAVTSTNAGESERITASQSEHIKEAVNTKINDNKIKIMSKA